MPRRGWACAGIAAVALAVRQLARWRSRRLRVARLANHTKIDLLPSERGPVLCMSPAISTVTFFHGSAAAAEAHLRERVATIVDANPWLAAVLDNDPESGEMAAFYPAHAASRRELFEVREGVPLSREGVDATAYKAMVRALTPVLCSTSDEAVGRGAPLFRVTLLPDASLPERRFALVVSANHSLLDGHGFYKVYNMLSTDGAVEALCPVRKQELPARMLEATGGEPSLMAACPPGFLARFVLGQLRAALFPQTRAIGFELSASWIAEQKAAAAAAGEVRFVSTNDVAVSSFLNCLRPECAIMAINLRGRLAGCGEEDVGNYEELITYMRGRGGGEEDDYATPTLLRKSVAGAPYRRAARPPTAMLSNWEHLRGAMYAAVTNWATFARPLTLGDGAAQELHLPLFDWDKACPACVFGSFIIFQPAAGRVAAMVAGKQSLIDAVKASGMAGAPIEMAM